MKTQMLVLALAAVALPAWGQDSAAIGRMQTQGTFERFSNDIRMQGMEQQQDAWRESRNPRVVRRAEEAAALINNGDCDGARALATRANDRRLLAGINRVCDAEAAAAPATAPAAAPASAPN
ncbi:hypothetical protein [Brevundimonas sp.]|uniref:hypothetical protein n=1 Tax=Brevundimonas sp. TaxID=1871086 RepID=UPI002D3F7FAC|nr:hypothetical protein [Brevundimonas sp.]HYC68521.1 hypothetical protein [Brevundimonas sp.]